MLAVQRADASGMSDKLQVATHSPEICGARPLHRDQCLRGMYCGIETEEVAAAGSNTLFPETQVHIFVEDNGSTTNLYQSALFAVGYRM